MINKHIHLRKKSLTLIYCILSNREVIKCHKFISVVVIELSTRCLITGPEDGLGPAGQGLINEYSISVTKGCLYMMKILTSMI